jgi:hypothetical protein
MMGFKNYDNEIENTTSELQEAIVFSMWQKGEEGSKRQERKGVKGEVWFSRHFLPFIVRVCCNEFARPTKTTRRLRYPDLK